LLYGPTVAGSVNLALTSLALPVGLIGNSMGKALFAEATSLGLANRDKILIIAKQVQIKLFLASLLPASVLFNFGEEIFSFLFGPAWREAGQYASLLSVYVLFQFTSSPLMQLLNIFRQQSDFLVLNIARAACVLALFIWASRYAMDPRGLLISYSIIMTIFYFLVSSVVMSKLNSNYS
jgi:O-antigen/teichoic acid export membrane protein